TSFAGISFDDQNNILSGNLVTTTTRAIDGSKQSVATVTFAGGKPTTSVTNNFATNGTTATTIATTSFAGISFDDQNNILSGNLVTTTTRAIDGSKQSVATVTFAGGKPTTSVTNNFATNGTTATTIATTSFARISFDDQNNILSGNLVTTTTRAIDGSKQSVATVTFAGGKPTTSVTNNF